MLGTMSAAIVLFLWGGSQLVAYYHAFLRASVVKFI